MPIFFVGHRIDLDCTYLCVGHCQRKVCNSIVGEKNGEFALKNEQEQEQDSEQLSEQEQEQEYLTNLVYKNNSLAGDRERE